MWVRDEVRSEAGQAVRRGRKPAAPAAPARRRDRGGADAARSRQRDTSGRGRSEPKPPAGDDDEIDVTKAVGPTRAARTTQRLKDATRAYEREQFPEARRLLRPLAADAPTVPAVRELLGLTYYRMGQWTQAVRELEAFRNLTGSTEQHPVLADCYRALQRWSAVESLWDELREVSPSADLVAEGRIVMAGALADRRRLPEAVSLLEKARLDVKRPQDRHLRMGYALADLRERSGDVPGARELFSWVARHDAEFADAAERSAQLA